MDSTKRIHDSSNLDELNQLKVWFFKENVRLQTLESELKNKEDELLEMKEQFQRETLETKRRLDRERQRLKNDEEFLRKNWTSLEMVLHSLILRGRKSKMTGSAWKRNEAPVSVTAGRREAQTWRNFCFRSQQPDRLKKALPGTA